ncbi:MAG: hypothetical protein WC480_03525 [Patescibacteria group bacterium]
MKSVTIVSAIGRSATPHLQINQDYYDTLAELIKTQLASPQIAIKIVSDITALEVLPCGQNKLQAVIFVSSGMLDEAKQLRQQHPELTVVVLSGEIPAGEIVHINIGWGLSPEIFQRIVSAAN